MPTPISGCDPTAALDLVSDAVIARMDGPPEKVRGLPNGAFTSPEFFELEQRRLFTRTWSFAGIASELPEVGDVRPVEVAGQPLLLIRGSDREIRVFHNVCPHRGAKLIGAPANAGSALTCVYHAWSYELDGRLRGRPHYDGPGRHDAAGSDEVCLFPVRSHTWYDWIFVNLDGRAPDFTSYLGEAEQRFDGYDLSALRQERHDVFEFTCNWKLAMENFCDYYHVFKTHPSLDQQTDPGQRGPMEIVGRHLVNSWSLVTEGHGLSADSSTLPLPALPNLPASHEQRLVYVGIFPNVSLHVFPTNSQFVLFEPVAPDRCQMHLWHYYTGDAAEHDAYRASRDEVAADWDHINGEDEGVCRRTQEGRHGAYDGGRLSPFWDRGTAHFHKMVAQAVRGDGFFSPAG